MDISGISFYLLSLFLLVTGILAVTSTKIFRSAIWLLFCLVGVAAFYFLMDMEFLGAVQIIIYVGGVVVLIIFSIFLTQQSGSDMKKPVRKRLFISALASLAGLALTAHLLFYHPFSKSSDMIPDARVETIGMQMLQTGDNGFVMPFELVSVLLLAAMIGCIVIAIKSRPTDA